MDFILTDLSASPAPSAVDGANNRGPYEMMKGKLDTIIMNPPFGTKLKGIDMVFLKKGIDVSQGHCLFRVRQVWISERIWLTHWISIGLL
jgi:type I restriction-modification system DNA methylase subunit